MIDEYELFYEHSTIFAHGMFVVFRIIVHGVRVLWRYSHFFHSLQQFSSRVVVYSYDRTDTFRIGCLSDHQLYVTVMIDAYAQTVPLVVRFET